MQGTPVQVLIQEDRTCYGANKPVHHSFWACVPEPWIRNCWAHVLQLLNTPAYSWSHNKRSHSVRRLRLQLESSPHSPQPGESPCQQRRLNAAKNKWIKLLKVSVWMHISSKKQFFSFANVNQRIRRWSIILFLDTYPK